MREVDGTVPAYTVARVAAFTDDALRPPQAQTDPMSHQMVIDLSRDAILTALMIAAPMLLIALGVAGMEYFSNAQQARVQRSIDLLTTTTLVATVSYADLLFQANELAQKTFRPLEVFTVTALIYFTVISMVSLIVHRVERRLAMSGETTVH